MRITKWGEYGILCSLYLARNSSAEPVGAIEIGDSQEIPIQYTQQILQRLRKGGIIESVRGPGGGYRLARTPDQISLHNILQAAEGDTFEVICDHNSIFSNCKDAVRNCSLRTVWHDLKATIDDFLTDKTLQYLLDLEDKIDESGASDLVPFPHRHVQTA